MSMTATINGNRCLVVQRGSLGYSKSSIIDEMIEADIIRADDDRTSILASNARQFSELVSVMSEAVGRRPTPAEIRARLADSTGQLAISSAIRDLRAEIGARQQKPRPMTSTRSTSRTAGTRVAARKPAQAPKPAARPAKVGATFEQLQAAVPTNMPDRDRFLVKLLDGGATTADAHAAVNDAIAASLHELRQSPSVAKTWWEAVALIEKSRNVSRREAINIAVREKPRLHAAYVAGERARHTGLDDTRRLHADAAGAAFRGAVDAVVAKEGVSRRAAVAKVSKEKPELREAMLGRGSASARPEAKAYLDEVERVRAAAKVSRADAIASVNRDRPDLRAAYVGRIA
jgi:hypothetical protein